MQFRDPYKIIYIKIIDRKPIYGVETFRSVFVSFFICF